MIQKKQAKILTVLLALIVGSQGFTLLHIKRAVAGSKSLASLSSPSRHPKRANC
ncbi:hypothetical protein [Ktedonobacter sp. SOSP1-52]|uniref:hypothetical protein n=1 Tax=Ktedonobacter sp. SOSP1-52 TaxID=2778366 RepID=UPI001915D68F|nr:hypothetical protein [Ktedonobacter sp. SOSP1-52]